MTLSLSTSTVLALLSGDPPEIRERFMAAADSGEDIRTSSIVLNELAFEIQQRDDPESGMHALGEFLTAVTVEPFGVDDALEAARLRRQLGDLEGEANPYALLILAQAIAREWTLVTRDVARAGAMVGFMGVSLMDWSSSDTPLDYNALLQRARAKPGK